MHNPTLDVFPNNEVPPLPEQLAEHLPEQLITRHSPEFSGKTGEYFGIWIVNLVLTVLTLGVYSAWAKVRTERYFYGHTRLAGASFEYLAQPLQILKGRLIAYAFLLVLGLSAKFQVFAVLIPLYLLLLACFPWLLCLSLRFRARYSVWRGLHFNFNGKTGDAYLNFMVLPIVSLFTLNLLSPWVHMQQHQYMVNGHQYGREAFHFQGEVGKYYIPFLIALALGFGVMMVMMVAIFGIAGLGMVFNQAGDELDPKIMMVLIPVFVVFYAAIFTIPIYLHTKYTNLMWQNASLGVHRLESTMRARDVIWLYFSNGVAILFTLGLAVPWAEVRMAKYKAAHFALLAQGGLDNFIANAAGQRDATGAELVDALDLDMNIGL